MLAEPLVPSRASRLRQWAVPLLALVVGAVAALVVVSVTHVDFSSSHIASTTTYTTTTHIGTAETLYRNNPQVAEIVAAALDGTTVGHITSSVGSLINFGTRHTGSSTTNATFGIGAARDWIHDQMRSYSGALNVTFDFFRIPNNSPSLPNGANATNVIARLRGSDPSDTRIIIIGGHYDSRASNNADFTSPAPGANDDGSGTVLAMEAARILARYNFPCEIMFVAFVAEEQGLFGAADLARKLRAQGANVYAVLNNDIVGGEIESSETQLDDPFNVRVFSIFGNNTHPNPSSNDSPQRLLARYIADMADTYTRQVPFGVKMNYRPDRFLRGGDQNAFNDQGFVAVRFCEVNENYFHQHQNVRVANGIQYGDLQQFMRSDYVSRVLALNLATAASIAWAPGPPRSVRLIAANLTNLSELTWLPPLDGASRVAGYEVLVRENSNNRWEYAVQIPAGTTRAVLPVTKDNFLFGVQSVDAFGRASLPVFPTV